MVGISRRLDNFSYSLQDSELYLRLLSRIAPELWVKAPVPQSSASGSEQAPAQPQQAYVHDVNVTLHIDWLTRATKLMKLFAVVWQSAAPQSKRKAV